MLSPCSPLPLKLSSTLPTPSLPPSTQQNPKPPLKDLEYPSHDFPCLPSNPNPNPVPPPSSTPNPWSNPSVLKPRPPKKFYLRFIPPVPRGDLVAGVCSPEAVAAELKVLDNTLVGFVMGKRPSFSLVKHSLLKQWKISGSVEILQLIQGGFGFRFSRLEDRDYILEIGVFYVGGLPIFLRPWERSIHTGGVLGLRKVPLWITLPGLPLHLWGEDSLSAICSVLGTPLFTDGTTAMKSRWVFARVCVEFSGDAPLLDSVLVEDDMGNQFQQVIKYGWKPPQCLTCGVFGHDEGSCLERDSGDALGVHHTAQGYSDSTHPVGKNEDGNGSNMAAGTNQEEVEGEEVQNGPPIVDDIRLKEKSSLSYMLLNRSWKNLNGKLPKRVRKKSPLELNPTRIHDSLHCHRLQPDLCPESGHMSCLEGVSNGPVAISSGRCAQSTPSPQFRNVFSKSPFPLLPRPTLSNRFRLLEADNDLTLSASPDLPAVSSYSTQMGPDIVSTPEAISAQPSDPIPNPHHPLPQKSTYRDQTSLCGESTCLEPALIGSSETTPSIDKNSPDPVPSSIGRTPYPSRSCNSSCSTLSGHLSFKQPTRKKFVGITSDELEKMMAPVDADPWYEDGKDDDLFMKASVSRMVDSKEELESEEIRSKKSETFI